VTIPTSLRPGISWPVAIAIGALVASAAPAQFGRVGLSAVGARMLTHGQLTAHPPRHGDQLGSALAIGDFNSNGAEDLAIGVVGDDGAAGPLEMGIVMIRYGVPGEGLPPTGGSAVLSQAVSGSPDPAEPEDNFGAALAACDLDGDLLSDLVVGVPYEDVAGAFEAGAVQIHRGRFFGLQSAGDLWIHEASEGVPGVPEVSGLFGGSLACGDFDGDGRDDLAIGVPRKGVNGATAAGSVLIVPGGPWPPDLAESFRLDQDSPGIADEPEPFDYFGTALLAADFDGDGYDDLVIGASGESVGMVQSAGAVHVVWGGPGGLTSTDGRFLLDSTFGDPPEPGDFFGASLGSGDFDGDGRADLVIGCRLEDLVPGEIADAGHLFVVYGSSAGFDLARNQIWTENAIHGTGASEADDHFGWSFASGDFDHDGFDDLAISHPGEFQLVHADGAVTVIVGSPSGLTANRRHMLVSGYLGLPGDRDQSNRYFGDELAAGDLDGDGYADLVVGAFGEDENGLDNVGAAFVYFGSLYSDGFETATTQFWSLDAP
jgi:hypothetical protein